MSTNITLLVSTPFLHRCWHLLCCRDLRSLRLSLPIKPTNFYSRENPWSRVGWCWLEGCQSEYFWYYQHHLQKARSKMVSPISINRAPTNERNSWLLSSNLSVSDFCQNTLIHSQPVRQSINLSTNYWGSDICWTDLMELIRDETRWSSHVFKFYLTAVLQFCTHHTYPLQIFNLQDFISDLS